MIKKQHFIIGYTDFFVYMKTDDLYKDIEGDVQKSFDTSSYELNRPLPKVRGKRYLD